MKSKWLKVLATAACLTLAVGFVSCGEEQSGGTTYALNEAGDGYILEKYDGTESNVTIPSVYKDLPVVEIKAEAFYNCGSLTSVTIPDSVTTIENGAFGYCTNLKEIVIPASVTTLGSALFFNCDNLTNIAVDADNAAYKSVDGNLYSKDGKTLIQYAVGKTETSFTISSDVTEISRFAFGGCDALTDVVIPDSVTTMGEGAFYRCASLLNVSMGSGITKIERWAFYDCDKMTRFEVSNSVTFISEMAFYNCSGLTEFIISSSVKSIDANAFNNCTSLTQIVIPASVTAVAVDLFLGCNLTIYCEAYSKPNRWDPAWNSSALPVVWGYVGE